MKLKALLKIHDQYTHPQALSGNLGDAYLLRHNALYRNIRAAAVKAKFKFTSKRFHNYDSLALTQLPAILSEKTIPYCDNLHAIREIEKKAPGEFTLGDIPPLRSNHLFHEAAHAAVHGLIGKHLGSGKNAKGIQKEREIALKTLLEEAFANACESFANLDALDDIHNEFLFKNSYIMEGASTRKLLASSVKRFGNRAVFKVLLLSFLHANFLRTSNAMDNLSRVIRISFSHQYEKLKTIQEKDVRLLQKLFKTGLELDPEFTVFTNQFCLRLLGIRTPLAKLFDYDFIKSFETHANYEECLDAMTALALDASL